MSRNQLTRPKARQLVALGTFALAVGVFLYVSVAG